MKEQHELLKILQERIENCSSLSNLLLKKQKALIQDNESVQQQIIILQDKYIKKILSNEKAWNAHIFKIKKKYNISSKYVAKTIPMLMDNEIGTKYIAYTKQFHQIINQLNRIKNNYAVIQKLFFVQHQKYGAQKRDSHKKFIESLPVKGIARIKPLIFHQKISLTGISFEKFDIYR
jgi:hypothetical protein